MEPFSDSFINNCFDAAFEEDANELDSFANNSERYKILDLINQGGMKQIHACYDSFTDRELARASQLDSQAGFKEFLQEIRISAKLEHPNIIPIYDIGLEKNQLFFTMKKLTGDNLQQYIKNTGIKETPLTKQLEIFLKVCDAIAFAHSKNILHLDLKPANIQVDEYGQVFVCDWGLARDLNDLDFTENTSPHKNNKKPELLLTLNNTLKGTPGYMAPEQIHRSFGSRDQRTDIFSLGSLLYFLLTGSFPYEGENNDAIIDATKKGHFRDPISRFPELNIPEVLNSICLKAMSLQKNDRYESVNTLRSDLRAYLNGFLTSVENPSFLKQSQLLIRRHKKVFISLMASCFIVIILSSLFVQSIRQERNAALEAQNHAERMSNRSSIAEQEAKRAQNESVELVNKLKKEELVSKHLRIEASRELMQRAFLPFYKKRNFHQADKTIKQILTLDPNYQEAQYYYGRLLLGASRFDLAYKTLKNYKGERQVDWMIESCLMFRNAKGQWIPKTWQKVLSMVQSWSKVPFYERGDLSWHINSSIHYHFSIEDCIQYAEAELKARHKFGPFNFKVHRQSEFIKLSLKGTKCEPYAVIRNWPLIELDLSDTNIKDLTVLWNMPLKKLKLANCLINNIRELRNLKLEELDLSGTNVDEYEPIYAMPIHTLSINELCYPLNQLNHIESLKILIIPKEAYSEKQLKSLRSSIKVIIK